jgi:hypothetical protein
MPTMRTHNSGPTSQSHCYLALSPRYAWTDDISACKEEYYNIYIENITKNFVAMAPFGAHDFSDMFKQMWHNNLLELAK